MTTPRRTRSLILAAMIGALLGGTASAQTPASLAEKPLEALMRLEVERVFGTSERLQPVTEAPSSVTIVTAAEIARYGYRTLADVLRSVRGFYVTNDRNYSYVGVRGMSRPGDYNTRVLLMVNGHRVNDNVYDQASIGSEFGIDAAMFERVEVIHGPASALYGTNAFFAVVNVVTRRGGSIDGASLDAEGGTLGSGLARATFGRRLRSGMEVALSASHDRSEGMKRIYFPEFDAPGTNGGVADGLDAERTSDLYGQIVARSLTVTAAFGNRVKYVPTASFFTLFNAHDPAERTVDRHLMLDARYNRDLGQTGLTASVSFDRASYGGVYPLPAEGTRAILVNTDGSVGARFGATVQATRALAAHQTVTAGGEFIRNAQQDQWAAYDDPAFEGFSLHKASNQAAAFAQDEIKIRPWLLLNGGVRFDAYSNFHRTTPRGAVIVVPSANHSFKYLFGRAFRAPNAYELYYYDDAADRLRPESIGTHELVWEAYEGERLRTSVSAYSYRASDLITLDLEPGTDDELAFFNAGVVHAKGIEFEGELRLKRGVQALASYSLQDAGDVSDASSPLTNSPRHLAKARLGIPGPHRSFTGIEWQFVGRRRTLAGSVDPASTINVTVTAPVTKRIELTAAVRNGLDTHYADPASDEHTSDSIEQNGRTLRVSVRWMWGER